MQKNDFQAEKTKEEGNQQCSGNKLKIFIIIFLIFLCIPIGYCYYFDVLQNKKSSENDNSILVDEEKKDETSNDKDEIIENEENDNPNKEIYDYPKVEIDGMQDEQCFNAWIEENFIMGDDGCLDYGNRWIYTLDKKNIIDNYEHVNADIHGKYAYGYKDNNITVYDMDGNIVEKIEKSNVIQIYDNYAIIHNNKKLSMYNIDTHQEVQLGTTKEGYNFEYYGTGYYDKDEVDSEHRPGYYITFVNWSMDENNSELDKETNMPLNAMEYYFIPETGETGEIVTYVGGYAKPVLYLYPKNDNTQVNITFENPGLLTTTYPKFNKSWRVTANKNGDLYDKDGKYYYGLYWEEEGSTKVDFKEGFFVTKENAIEFLEEKLSIIGLSDRERNEFIMYWLPILEKNGKNLVYFELTEQREKYNKLNITPTPDSLLRMAIHVKKVDKKVNIKEQKLEKFKRIGFAAVEWGGVIH